MPIYSSDSDDGHRYSASSSTRLFGHKSLHAALGGRKVADVVLWRKKSVSAAILLGASFIWFLFEVAEYHFVTLLCHLSITAMLLLFISCHAAPLFNRSPPKIPEIILSESAFKQAAMSFHRRLSQFIINIYHVSSGRDLPFFLLAIGLLWILAVIGTYFSITSLLYLGILCVMTLPVLYENYQDEVNRVAKKGNKNLKKLYRKLDSKVFNKIPRGPVKPKKSK
ncbi:hypothetical protein Scep_016284 [Stephania cephalantha]|uniref:Reticulon-like protein n=1 Tax=Stephania cephalantha TaxID=152367 RepID=A0AAP0IME1_9MAGN